MDLLLNNTAIIPATTNALNLKDVVFATQGIEEPGLSILAAARTELCGLPFGSHKASMIPPPAPEYYCPVH